ncbi:hypothetical protein OTK49_00470 [Vibrio coralliirubri]|uniref:hypothetical protein n=1 Tax=Vibrio coralliirubri TaxID=1516159 RepID=UPI0022835896|nr:hypothetical protein [Vibrio coralliirubri]MCY9861015.1 hypothetical protein [Vibrio coralliirubri]
MKFSINRVASAVAVTLIFSSTGALATTTGASSPDDPLACTEAEIQAIMKQYDSSLGELNKYHPPSFDKYREVRMVHRAQDPKKKDENLCEVLMDANFKVPAIDLEKLKAAWASLKALMAGNSGGMNWSQAMKEAYDAGMQKYKEWWRDNQCKLAQDLSTTVNGSIDDAYDASKEEAKDQAEDAILENESVQDAGITDLDDKDKPIWQQAAQEQTENQLGDYGDYANWYETDDWKGENQQESMDDLIDKVLGDVQEDALDEHLDNEGDDRLDNILDKFEPNYDK